MFNILNKHTKMLSVLPSRVPLSFEDSAHDFIAMYSSTRAYAKVNGMNAS